MENVDDGENFENFDDAVGSFDDDTANLKDIVDIVDDVIASHDPHHIIFAGEHQLHCNEHSLKPKKINYEALKPFFLHASTEVIKRTFQATTQYARTTMGGKTLEANLHVTISCFKCS